jgi:DNA-binding transcriptional MerR regulator
MPVMRRDVELSISEPDRQGLYSIGELSREFAISTRTLRFYEERGFLECIRFGKARFYSEAHRKRLQAILQGRKLGFSLTEIGQLLSAMPDIEAIGTLSDTISSGLLAAQIGLLEQRQREISAALAELRQEQQRREQRACVSDCA